MFACVIVAASCAAPTQIVVEVFTDACPGSGKPEVVTSTGIAVGTAENIETQRPASTHVGCESPTGVGTLTIYPSGADDDEVAIKVLGGVEVAPDRCDPPDYAGCIVSQRTMRFVPHETERLTVVLSLACLNRKCPDKQTCDNGACIDPAAILSDGGTNGDVERQEASPVDAFAVIDAPVTGTDGATSSMCAGCQGTCDGTRCRVDCTSERPCTGNVCSAMLPCEINCNDTGSCKAIACSTAGASCMISCKDTNACQSNVNCQAANSNCDIECDAPGACDSAQQITINAATGTFDCNGDKSCQLAFLSCTTQGACSLMCSQKNGGNASCNQIVKPTCDGHPCNGFPNGM